MKETQNISANFSSLTGNVKAYIRLKLELYKIMATEGIAVLISSIMITLVVMFLLFFILFFLALAFIYWYGEYAGPMYIGALIIVGFYFMVSVVVFFFRDQLFVNPLIKKLTDFINQEDGDETD